LKNLFAKKKKCVSFFIMSGVAQMTIFTIKEKLRYQEFEISLHAFEEAVDDFLLDQLPQTQEIMP